MKKRVIAGLSAVVGAGVALAAIMGIQGEKDRTWKEMSDKHLALMLLFNQWMITKQEGKEIVSYLHKKNIKSIAIYGMSYVGERLYDELKEADIEIKYIIDKNAESIYAEVDVISLEEELMEVDAIIVTPVFYFNEIKDKLKVKTEAEIISLEDILYEL